MVTAESRELILSRVVRPSWLESVMGSILDWDVVTFCSARIRDESRATVAR